MTKVLLLQDKVSPVRIPIYNKIAEKCDFTIMHSADKFPPEAAFKNYKVEKFTLLGRSVYKKSLFNIIKNYDVVIAPLAYVKIDVLAMLYLLKSPKVILWGIGVPASYHVRYDAQTAKNKLPKLINKADAALFYTDYPKIKYSKMGLPEEKMFVANNTAPVNKHEFSGNRNSLLFVGTLYPQKKVMELVYAYASAYEQNKNIMPLNIIGNGDEYLTIEAYIKENKLEDKIKLLGAIYDDSILEKYFLSAYACISPDQAGLSVLKSMGYGVAFVTTQNAITGGERFNIKNNENGILMKDLSELKNVLIDIGKNPDKYIDMGKNAYDYYWKNRLPEQMAAGFLKAIDYVMSKKKKR